LQPASTHLVVVGIGSGKTTQLLVAEDRLAKLPDTVAVYLDVSTLHDISKLQPKVLLVLAGQRLATMLTKSERASLSAPLARLDEIRRGYHHFEHDYSAYEDEPDPDDYPDPDPPGKYVWNEPVIVPPATEAQSQPPRSEPADILGQIKSKLSSRAQHFILLFDGMDRVVDTTRFEQVVMDDLAVMRALGIGVVVVGPTKLLYGTYREITRRFDQMHPVTWPDPDNVDEHAFLLRVLQARAPEGLLSEVGALRLVDLSGGVLRDLIGIARNAGEEAYLSGDEVISAAHAEAAGEAFGRGLLFGLDADELGKLQKVRVDEEFIPTTDKDLALLTSGRVLQYQGASMRYVVHPTIHPLLEQLAVQA
jgi:hypothetical protein